MVEAQKSGKNYKINTILACQTQRQKTCLVESRDYTHSLFSPSISKFPVSLEYNNTYDI